MKMYKANYIRNKIEEIEITRKTDKTIFFNCSFFKKERREAIKSSYCEYFDTYKQAKHAILEEIKKKGIDYTEKLNSNILEYEKAYKEL